MDIDKFINESCLFEDFIDIRREYTIADVKEIVSEFTEYWEDATPEDFEELLSIIEEYIEDQKDIAITDELEVIERYIRESIYDSRDFCSNQDILKLLVNIANDYV